MGMTPFKASYDAWGNQTLITETLFFRRGYTGHEMLPEYGLINMNGRLYDPQLGRFLSPDNYVQMPDFSQSFNRYSYCINNPLKFTDPDGENPLLIAAGIAAIIGGAINVAEHWDQIDNFWQGLGYFGVGALAWGGSAMLSSVSFGLGGAVGGLVSGAIQGGSAGFIIGGGNALISGDSFWKNALRYSMYGAAFGGVMNGVFSGLSSWYNGNNFWTGKSINTTTTITNANRNIIPENNKSILQYDNSVSDVTIENTSVSAYNNSYSIEESWTISNTDPQYQNLLRDAQKRYPNKAGKIEMHHVTPKYLGGPKEGPLIPLDAAYHQMITNEFRRLWGYKLGIPSFDQQMFINSQVYTKWPLPLIK